MPRSGVLLVMALAACSLGESQDRVAAPDMQGWRFASGKEPSPAEYAAVLAACRDGAVPRTRGEPLEACLTDLGLRRR